MLVTFMTRRTLKSHFPLTSPDSMPFKGHSLNHNANDLHPILAIGPQRISFGCPKPWERPIVPGMFQSDGKLILFPKITTAIF